MISNLKQKIMETGVYKTYEWIKFTRQIGLNKKNSNPSSTKTKQILIKKIALENEIDTFIETGTYLGDMVNANLQNFRKIFSVELDKKLYERARKRFGHSKHVKILHGDSAAVLGPLVKKNTNKTLFWLDAHYSGGITAKGDENTPIEKELKIILRDWKLGNVIVIDDARLFTGQNGYPRIETVRKLFTDNRLKTEIYKDMIIVK